MAVFLYFGIRLRGHFKQEDHQLKAQKCKTCGTKYYEDDTFTKGERKQEGRVWPCSTPAIQLQLETRAWNNCKRARRIN